MFTVEMLPAEYGDCLWIEYGTAKAKHRILIDTGTPGAFPALKGRIEKLSKSDRLFDLFVVSHIDADHIGGAIKLLKKHKDLGISFGDIWFNGYVHLKEAEDRLGPVQGEELTAAIVNDKLPWNRAFEGKAVAVSDTGNLPQRKIGDMALTLLSPYPAQLAALAPIWEKVVTEAGLTPGGAVVDEEEEGEDRLGSGPIDMDALVGENFKADAAPANASSIAFLAEFEGKQALFAADAHARVLLTSLNGLSKSKKISLDAVKLPHHGSKANVSPDLLAKISCKHFLISTNGKKFRHPDRQAMARTIRSCRGASLVFNYNSEFTQIWNDEDLQQTEHYRTVYPNQPSGGIRVDI